MSGAAQVRRADGDRARVDTGPGTAGTDAVGVGTGGATVSTVGTWVEGAVIEVNEPQSKEVPDNSSVEAPLCTVSTIGTGRGEGRAIGRKTGGADKTVAADDKEALGRLGGTETVSVGSRMGISSGLEDRMGENRLPSGSGEAVTSRASEPGELAGLKNPVRPV